MNALKESFRYFKKYTAAWIGILLIAFISVVCMELLPQAPQLIIDRIINPLLGAEIRVSQNNVFTPLLSFFGADDYWGMFLMLAGVCMGLAILRYVCHYTRWNMSHFFGVTAERGLRGVIFKRLIEQNSVVLDRYTSGDLLSIANSDPTVMKDFYTYYVGIIFEQVCVICLSIYFLSLIHWALMIVPLAVGLFTVFVTVKYIKALRRNYDNIRNCSANLNSVVQENINGVRIVRAFSSEDVEIEKFDKKNVAYRDAYVRQASTLSRYQALFNSLGYVVALSSIVIGVVLASFGTITPGEFLTFMSYATMIQPPLITITNFLGNTQNAMICGNRMFTFLKMENIIKDGERAIDPGAPDISLSNVSVALEGSEQIYNVDLELPYGKKLGIMGRTGAGKSVLIKTLPRFFEVTQGEMRINGLSVKDYKVDDVRRLFSYVPQDVFLYSETVKNNIAFYDERADFESVKKAARAAEADGFIGGLSEGYDTVVGERGLGLSGGQKQRISIARALLKDSPVLLLDDCTSALDLETERRILNNLKTEYGGKTLVIASHRATSVEGCDEILYLEEGRIAERGTHAELMERKGKYYEVYTSQEAKRREALLDG